MNNRGGDEHERRENFALHWQTASSSHERRRLLNDPERRDDPALTRNASLIVVLVLAVSAVHGLVRSLSEGRGVAMTAWYAAVLLCAAGAAVLSRRGRTRISLAVVVVLLLTDSLLISGYF